MRIHRKLALVGLAAVALAASACQGSASEQAEETAGGTDCSGGITYSMPAATELPAAAEAIKAKGKLVFGTKFDQPTTGLKNPATGCVEGFDANMGRLLAQRIFGEVKEGEGGNLEFVETISKNREEFLKSGTVDALAATYTINDERKALVDFAGPYYVTGQGILTKKDVTDINTLDDLSGKKVCVAVGSNSLTNLEKLNADADVSAPLTDYSACKEAVANGTYDAMSTDLPILFGFAQTTPDTFRVSEETFTEEPYGIATKHGDEEFRNFINDMLEESFTNGDWVKAFEATLGAAGATTPDPLPTVERY